MNKNIITEVKRISDLMGIKNIISEATNPIMRLLRTLTQYEAEVTRITGKTLAQLNVSDLKKFWNKLPKGLTNELMRAVDQKLSSIISKDLIAKSTYEELKRKIIASGVEPYFAGKWVRNFVEENNVDTVDDYFENLLKKQVVSEPAKIIFDITKYVTPKQKQIIDDAAAKIEKSGLKELTEADYIKLEKMLRQLGVDLNDKYQKYLKSGADFKKIKNQQKAEKMKAAIDNVNNLSENVRKFKVWNFAKALWAVLALVFVAFGTWQVVGGFCNSFPRFKGCNPGDALGLTDDSKPEDDNKPEETKKKGELD